jgi:hypothetical protein
MFEEKQPERYIDSQLQATATITQWQRRVQAKTLMRRLDLGWLLLLHVQGEFFFVVFCFTFAYLDPATVYIDI